jgi:hypothetical protein
MQYSITPIIRNNLDREPSGYAENPGNWIFLKIGYNGSLQWEKISANGYFRLRIYLRTNKTLIHNSVCVFDSWDFLLYFENPFACFYLQYVPALKTSRPRLI